MSIVTLSKNKCFSPSTNQLNLLNLKEGKNEITFTVRSRLSGTHKLTADIYCWNSDAKIVISDVDGTITKSDVLGQMLPIIGKDWSHKGVANLFNNIDKNEYKIIYLTARALCQSSTTKNYLQSLKQNNLNLPRGPILMSPDGLISSFKREVIDKTPQIFKISCLNEVQNLFPLDYFPFVSGFGNKPTDALAYKSVGVELERIFIIDESGDIKQMNNSFKKSYDHLNEIVHEIFPSRVNKN